MGSDSPEDLERFDQWRALHIPQGEAVLCVYVCVCVWGGSLLMCMCFGKTGVDGDGPVAR